MDEYKFYRFLDQKSILVITPKNKLIRVKCPFVVKDIDNKFFLVQAVLTKNNSTFYLIGHRTRVFHDFRLV